MLFVTSKDIGGFFGQGSENREETVFPEN
jgi:hypothetical protein